MKKIVWVMNIPSPYRLHTFRMIEEECKKRRIHFSVHLMSHGHPDRPRSWMSPKIDVPHRYWQDFGRGARHWNPGMVLHLLKERPDWIHLGSPFDTFTCIAVALFNRKSVLCAGCEGNTKTPGKMDGVKGWFKRLIFSKCPYVTVPGVDGARYIKLHQARTKKKMPDPILLPNLVDETCFRPRSKWGLDEIETMRHSLEVVNEDRLCLIPARLEPAKGLLEMVALMDVDMLMRWKIVIIGQGRLKDELFELIRQRGLGERISVLDFVAYEKMPLFYASSDLLLLPSVYDPNPLTLIEAIHTGLPIAASDQCGNIEEAVTEGRNGWRLPVKDAWAFREKLVQIFKTPLDKLREMGNFSLSNNARFWNSKLAAEKYVDAVEDAMKW